MTHFRCEPLRCSISVDACARRSTIVSAAAGRGGSWHGGPSLQSNACATCSIGPLHAAGELPSHWPDGSPIVRLTLAPHLSATPTHEDPTMPMPPKPITFGGEPTTIPELAKRTGVNVNSLRDRIRRGMGADEAIAILTQSGPSKRRAKPEAAPGPAPTADARPSAAIYDAINGGARVGMRIDSEPARAERVDVADPCEVLRSLGWDVTDHGRSPGGHRILAVQG